MRSDDEETRNKGGVRAAGERDIDTEAKIRIDLQSEGGRAVNS